MNDPPLKVPDASRQVAFHQLLVAARKTWLKDALAEALGRVDPAILKTQLLEYVPADAQKILAGAGVRDEHVFPTPIVLEAMPTLVGYYRLLLGLPQKTFYGGGQGMSAFKRMEVKGVVTERQRARLPEFCTVMGKALAELVRQVSPTITPRDVDELPLLTLGSFFQGANNVLIGKQATLGVFLAIADVVEKRIVDREDQKITVRNASKRTVLLIMGTDPDVRIEEDFSGNLRKKVAIEIKGGTDKSNAHNRAGEAEKSHQKAKNQGFRDFWTIISTKGLDRTKLESESPTTKSWFDISQVLGREGADWEEFRSQIAESVGIPVD